MSSTDYLAITALVVAFTSLIVTTAQLLGQYFATADGYRRCQPSVMGAWADRTRLRWRWAQFRFEILFTTPDIFLHSFRVDQNHQRVGKLGGSGQWITGSLESERLTMIGPDRDTGPNNRSSSNLSDERVCWIPFLAALHRHERAMTRHGCYRASSGGAESSFSLGRFRSGPALDFQERSWDFMSPDIVRPFAVTNVADLAILVRRLGMTWKDF